MKREVKTLKSYASFFCILIVFLSICGCGFAGLALPERPATAERQEIQEQELREQESQELPPAVPGEDSQENAPASTQEPAEKVQEEVIEEETIPDQLNDTVTNETEVEEFEEELEISGSLELQGNLELCPHLEQHFECDKYDVRNCEFKQTVGKEGFFPDYIICRSRDKDGKEEPGKRYCFIQECGEIQEEGIVQSYGGHVAYAEYDYKKESTETGIMTYYDLKRCGERMKEFNDKFDCTIYYSEWRELWE